ncbi:VRR-NUC domain-containing protein [Microbulbifer agarilyticus]|uniref:VRR-NUC domain-containing protein n=1 Tax=Microbulbifer agarilyticus TaxID=260552 RepID=UPI001C983EB5|nr:VRR-NUC domain-containing protein [Microbulbifer agarilyticus]MBY6211309.1 VRR-NUC domain-containing protein [Microbulbifer agarilyticus]
MAEPVELAPDYYLSNFHALVEFVVTRYDALLSDEERCFHQCFCALDTDSQKLYVRLLSRKGVPSTAGALFRQSKLAYQEIHNLPQAAETLVTIGLFLRNPAPDLTEILPLFTKTELLASSAEPLPKTLKRPALEQALLEQDHDALRTRLTLDEPLLAVQAAAHFETFKLLFFGNLNQDLTDYVLRDLGLFRYENYPLEQSQLPFKSRAQVERHLHYYACVAQLEQALSADAQAITTLAAELPENTQGDTTLQRRLDRLRLALARQLERLQALEAANTLYQQCQRPPARERRARIAATQGNTDAALAICAQILGQPENEQEREFAASFGHRTAKKTPHCDTWPAPMRYRAPTRTVTLAQTDERVEVRAAHYLADTAAGNQCFYVENTLINGVLGLAIWDIVFAPVPGAFFNPFQVAPSDFRSADFYPQRRAAFTQRLEELQETGLDEWVWHYFREKRGIANPLVHWDALSEPVLELALSQIPIEHWLALFRRLLDDITLHRSGFPDLILFPAGGGYELVEIKGPGDRLQQNQQRWLAYFAQHRIPHQVLHVEWGTL